MNGPRKSNLRRGEGLALAGGGDWRELPRHGNGDWLPAGGVQRGLCCDDQQGQWPILVRRGDRAIHGGFKNGSERFGLKERQRFGGEDRAGAGNRCLARLSTRLRHIWSRFRFSPNLFSVGAEKGAAAPKQEQKPLFFCEFWGVLVCL